MRADGRSVPSVKSGSGTGLLSPLITENTPAHISRSISSLSSPGAAVIIFTEASVSSSRNTVVCRSSTSLGLRASSY